MPTGDLPRPTEPRVLGVDPGVNTGCCLVQGGRPLQWWILRAPTHWDLRGAHVRIALPRRRDFLETELAHLLVEIAPDIVAIENPRVDEGAAWAGGAESHAKQHITRHLEDLSRRYAIVCASLGIPVVMVEAGAGKAAIGARGVKTRRGVVEIFERLYGIKLKVGEDHVARAAGVALRAERKLALERAGPCCERSSTPSSHRNQP